MLASKPALALRQASEESASLFLVSYFCND